MGPVAFKVLNEDICLKNPGYVEPRAGPYRHVFHNHKMTYSKEPLKVTNKQVISYFIYPVKNNGVKPIPHFTGLSTLQNSRLRKSLREPEERHGLYRQVPTDCVVPAQDNNTTEDYYYSIICCWPAANRGNGAVRNQSDSMWSSWRRQFYCYSIVRSLCTDAVIFTHLISLGS